MSGYVLLQKRGQGKWEKKDQHSDYGKLERDAEAAVAVYSGLGVRVLRDTRKPGKRTWVLDNDLIICVGDPLELQRKARKRRQEQEPRLF